MKPGSSCRPQLVGRCARTATRFATLWLVSPDLAVFRGGGGGLEQRKYISRALYIFVLGAVSSYVQRATNQTAECNQREVRSYRVIGPLLAEDDAPLGVSIMHIRDDDVGRSPPCARHKVDDACHIRLAGAFKWGQAGWERASKFLLFLLLAADETRLLELVPPPSRNTPGTL